MVIILDLMPLSWINGVDVVSAHGKITLLDFVNIIHHFLKTYAYMSVRNKCCIIGMLNTNCKILYEGFVSRDWLASSIQSNKKDSKKSSSTLQLFWKDTIAFMGTFNAQTPTTVPALTTAISMGLLYLNRQRLTRRGYGTSILVLDVRNGCDYRAQYLALMNLAFAASKHNISISACSFVDDSMILLQVCDYTGGKHLHLESIFKAQEPGKLALAQSIAQLLTFWLIPPPCTGSNASGSDGGVVNRGATAANQLLSGKLPVEYANVSVCSCHNNAIQIGFLCPCCFAVYCSERDDSDRVRIICSTCGSRLVRRLVRNQFATDASLPT